MRVDLLYPARARAARRVALISAPWVQPIHAEIHADFGDQPAERQLAELRPWGPKGGVTVSCCSLGGHYQSQTLDRDPDADAGLSHQAVKMLATFFFGSGTLTPRITGRVDWVAASLALRDRSCGDAGDGLLRLNIRPVTEGPRKGTASCRLEQEGASKSFLVHLRPTDADPLFAVLRVALGIDVDRGFTS